MSESSLWNSSPVIKNVVVKDGGKLLVIGTLYGGITMSLRHDDTQYSAFTKVALVELATMLFVDVMRLFCVAGSDAARKVNIGRYSEFVSVADQHLRELGAQITRSAAFREAAVSMEASQIDRKLIWGLQRLRTKAQLDRPWNQFATFLAEFAVSVHSFCKQAAPEYYARCKAETEALMLEHRFRSLRAQQPDDFVHARFGVQSAFLVRFKELNGLDIGTIKDDIERVLAVPYFTIDRTLLQRTLPQHGTVETAH